MSFVSGGTKAYLERRQRMSGDNRLEDIDMKPELRKHASKLALALGLLGSLTAHAAEPPPQGYVMIVYSDLSHGKKIMRGAPEEVIARLSRRIDGPKSGVADQINLCVAYAKTKQIDLATTHCDAAVAESSRAANRGRSSNMFGRQEARAALTDRAIALSNRGVLHALLGESDKATLLFEMAMSFEATEEYAQNNLARLEASIVESDS